MHSPTQIPPSLELREFRIRRCRAATSNAEGASVELPPNREIRIFISSTFCDMQRERDVLVKRVFPNVRKLCEDRGVVFTEIDLRWGVTAEQASNGEVLDVCFREIERCQPYFIGLLGERYGSVLNTIDLKMSRSQTWLSDVAPRSITELEILHGVLNDPRRCSHASFYFRDPAFINKLPAEQKPIFLVEDATSAEKLRQLKQNIRDAANRGDCQLRDGYADPEQLADWITHDLTDLINRLYPPEDVPDEYAREKRGHAMFATQKLLAHVSRPEHDRVVDEFFRDRTAETGLIITGEIGAGKSTLLANFVRQHERSKGDICIFSHFFGATPRSATIPLFLSRLLADFRIRFQFEGEISTNIAIMRDQFARWLADAAHKATVVLVLDGLDQIDGNEFDRSLGWLPQSLSNIRIIASSVPGRALDELRRRGWREHTLTELHESERQRVIKKFCGHYGKTPSTELRRELVGESATGNPLFLRTLLEELRQFGTYEELPQKAREYLSAANPTELFRKIIRRWQVDFDADCNLVSRTFRVLWAARRGLTESEWLHLLGDDERKVPRRTWSPLFLAIRPHLAHRGGLYTFDNDFLRAAVQQEILPTSEHRAVAHRAVATYFSSLTLMSERKADEWPWQLKEAGLQPELLDALTDLELFSALYTGDTKWELASYWQPLQEQGHDMSDCYIAAYDQLEYPDMNLTYSLGSFLIENGCSTVGTMLMQKAADGSKQAYQSLGEFDVNYMTAQANLARLLEEQGQHERAGEILQRVLGVYEVSFGHEHRHTATACTNLARNYAQRELWPEAEKYSRRAVEIDEQFFGPEHPEVAKDLLTLGSTLGAVGRVPEAEEMLRRALAISRKHLPPKHPDLAIAINNLSGLLVQSNRFEEAESFAQEALEIDRVCLGSSHPTIATRLNTLAYALHRLGRASDAATHAQEALRILVAHSVRSGALHQHVKSAANTFVRFAVDSGLQEPLAVGLANGILSDLKNMDSQRATASRQHQKIDSTGEPSKAITDSSAYTKPPKDRTPLSKETPSSMSPASSQGANSGTVENSASEREEFSRSMSNMDRIQMQLNPRNLTVSAEDGDAISQLNVAVDFETKGDHSNAAMWYRRAAEQGIAQAQYNLAVCLQNGQGVQRDYVEALQWYERAAQQNYLNAIYNLAFMREHGHGCDKDLSQAFALYRHAADHHEPDSQMKVALLLFDNNMRLQSGIAAEGWDFVKPDHDAARSLLRDAASNGHRLAAMVLQNLNWH